MNFNDFIDLDISANAILLKSYNENISSLIKLNKQEIKEIKIKKEVIAFFTTSTNFDNPIKPEFTINIYTTTKDNIELIYEYEDKETLIKLEEFIKSILI